MDPILLQQQLKSNNKDLLDFCEDLKSWGEEMQTKEQKYNPITESKHGTVPKGSQAPYKKENMDKKKIVKSTNQIKEAKRKMSYADWEKFDADKECEMVDSDSDSELTDEIDESMKGEALAEKDKGNKFVRSAKWDEAIKCYTKAIEYFAYDPIFYANRALCYLKKKENIKAENDCNTSLKLDNTYVKAYQRRAAARELLDKLEEAKLDLLRVLELEPKNSESRSSLEKLKVKIDQIKSNGNQRPVSRFTASRQQKKGTMSAENAYVEKNTIDSEKPQTIWPSGDKKNLVKSIKKPPHLRSKKPLKRIAIKEINSLELSSSSEKCQEKISSWPTKDKHLNGFKSDDIKIIEHKLNTPEMQKEEKNLNNVIFKKKEQVNFGKEEEKLIAPKSSVQFHTIWKKLIDQNLRRYEYLKLIDPKIIPNIFKESLESQTFSEILQILTEYFIGENDGVYKYLFHLTEIKRFRALTMFLTLNDKNCLWKMFNRIKECEGHQKEDIDSLIKKYELL